MRHMESTACYFLARSFRTHQYEICRSRRMHRELVYVISFLPYYWRAMQVHTARENPCHKISFKKYYQKIFFSPMKMKSSFGLVHLFLTNHVELRKYKKNASFFIFLEKKNEMKHGLTMQSISHYLKPEENLP